MGASAIMCSLSQNLATNRDKDANDLFYGNNIASFLSSHLPPFIFFHPTCT